MILFQIKYTCWKDLSNINYSMLGKGTELSDWKKSQREKAYLTKESTLSFSVHSCWWRFHHKLDLTTGSLKLVLLFVLWDNGLSVNGSSDSDGKATVDCYAFESEKKYFVERLSLDSLFRSYLIRSWKMEIVNLKQEASQLSERVLRGMCRSCYFRGRWWLILEGDEIKAKDKRNESEKNR